jgi:hypothetical protein
MSCVRNNLVFFIFLSTKTAFLFHILEVSREIKFFYSLLFAILGLSLTFFIVKYILTIKGHKKFMLGFAFCTIWIAGIIGVSLAEYTIQKTPAFYHYALIGILIFFLIFFISFLYQYLNQIAKK